MKLYELIEAHGPIMAAEDRVGTVVCYAHDERVFTVATSDMNGDYTPGEQYDAEEGTDFDSIEAEAGDLLDDVLSGADGNAIEGEAEEADPEE